jgi:hypothetical protein
MTITLLPHLAVFVVTRPKESVNLALTICAASSSPKKKGRATTMVNGKQAASSNDLLKENLLDQHI